MIRIDGSMGEGGGQMLRSALSLSLVTGKAFRMENIRAKREKPGLLRQHLTAVLAACEIASAQAEGATLGSKTLTFTPGPVRPGNYHFAIGTAGSGTLVFQTILPALMTASGRSEITIEGGTHNMQAPPLDFLQKAFLPVVNRLGPKIEIRLEKYGFYPAGGGRFIATIEPCERLSSIQLLERGEIQRRRAVAIVANLPRSIAHRETDTIVKLLNWDGQITQVVETRNSVGPGNIILIELASSNVTEVFCGFGRIGASAESVASEAADAARSYLVSGAVAGEHLTDQLLLPFALAGGGAFTGEKLNLHSRTNMEIIRRFLAVDFVTSQEGALTRVSIET
ncbi:MAG TPA: RNA 3'-terminal phosphate cyclase [Nitrospira sp.]|nr:RNA 3'-terminal phosphate cyclase [Nitrospira sp.]